MNTQTNHLPPSEVDEQVEVETEEYREVAQQRRHVFPRAALVGLLASGMAVAFRAALAGCDSLREHLIRWGHTFPIFGWLLPVLFGAICAGFSVYLVRRFAPETSGSGIPHLEAVVYGFRSLSWRRVLPVKFIGGMFALSSGLVIGWAGPAIQMGGAVGAAVAEGIPSARRDRSTLIAAGAGAGMAAAFNAPLSGLVFVLEEVQKDFRPVVFGAAFVAVAVANLVARAASGQLPVFHVPTCAAPSLWTLPIFAILGIVCGLLGVVFNRSLLTGLNLYARIPDSRRVSAAALVGGILGGIAWFMPQAVGGGQLLTERFLIGNATLLIASLFFLIRFGLTLVSYGTGAPGGIFAPLLGLGAMIGLGVGLIAHQIAPQLVNQPAVFAVVGMGAYFTAIVRAPLTGVVLIVEMTGDYALMLPLLIACFGAYVVAEYCQELPLYESLLERDLRGGNLSSFDEPNLRET